MNRQEMTEDRLAPPGPVSRPAGEKDSSVHIAHTAAAKARLSDFHEVVSFDRSPECTERIDPLRRPSSDVQTYPLLTARPGCINRLRMAGLMLWIAVAVVSMPPDSQAAAGGGGWYSYSKDGDNSRIADDAVTPPLRLKWKVDLDYLNHPSYSRLYYADGKVMVARMSADGSGAGYGSTPDKTVRAYDAFSGGYLWESNCPKWSDSGDRVYGTNAEWVINDGYMWGSTGRENCRIDLSNGDTWILDPYNTGTHNSYVNADGGAIYSMGYDQISDGNIVVKAAEVLQNPVMGHTSEGRFGQAYQFPGVFTTQDYLVANDILTSPTNDWTAMFWFNWNGVYSEGPKTFFVKGSRSVDMGKFYNALPSTRAYRQIDFHASYISGLSLLDPYYGEGGQAIFASMTPRDFALDMFDPGFPFYEWAGGSGSVRTSARAINWLNVERNTWYHFAITYDHKSISIYRNGEQIFQEPYEGEIGDDEPGTFYIGGFRELGSFGGKLDEFAVFDKALSASEIQATYDSPIVPTSSTRMLLHFDNDPAVGESDSRIHDYSGNGNDAYYDGHVNQKLLWKTPRANPSNMGGGGSGINGNLYGLTMFPGGRGYGMGDIAVHEGVLYVPNGKMTAHDAASGQILWQTGNYPMSPKASDVAIGGVVYYSGAVYSDGKIYVMGREALGPDVATTITVGSGTFVGYTSSQQVTYCSNFSEPALYSLDAGTGSVIGKIAMPEYAKTTQFEPFAVAPFNGRGESYYDRHLWTDTYHYAARQLDSKMVWESIVQPFQTIVQDGVAYVSATDRIAAYDTTTGTKLWEYGRSHVPSDIYGDLSASDSGDMLLSGDLLYAIEPFSDEIIAIKKTNGQVVWRFRSPDRTEKFTGLIEADHMLFASTYNDDKLYAFDEVYQNPAITNPTNDSTMPLGHEGEDCHFDFTVKDGQYPYSWTVTSGTLPLGLQITGTNVGYLAGAPAESGDFGFTVRVTDARGNHDERKFFVRILPHDPPSIDFRDSVPKDNAHLTSDAISIDVITSSSSASYAFVDFDRSNVLWLTMNQIDTDTSFGGGYEPYVQDHSSHANRASYKGHPVWTPFGYSGGGYNFDGASYLQVDRSLPTTESVTLSLWVCTEANSDSEQALINSSAPGCYYNPRIYIENGRPYGYSYLYDSSNRYKSVTISGDETITDGEWHQVALVVDATSRSLSLFVDGVLKNRVIAPDGYWIKKLGTITIGNALNGSGHPFKFYTGKIDDVLMFSRPLSPAEISALFHSSAHQAFTTYFSDLSVGWHSFSAYAVDAYGNVSQAGPRNIAVGHAPGILPIRDDTVMEERAYHGPVPELTTGTLPVSWKLVEGPSGMTINPDSGAVSWPASSSPGSLFHIRIRATSPFGQADSSWKLKVTPYSAVTDWLAYR